MKKEKHVCVICGKEFEGYGNNPDPAVDHGRCCDDCNLYVVVPVRLGAPIPEQFRK